MNRRLLAPSALVLLLACAGNQEAPPRPATVPAGAAWVPGKPQAGGASGVFVRMRTAGGLDWRIEIWDDLDGAKVGEGRYVAKGAAYGEIKGEDLVFWDGEAFTLRGGGTLERAK